MLPKVTDNVHWTPPEGGCWAAIVTEVNEANEVISLTVFPPKGGQPFPTGDPDRTEGTEGGQWHWPETTNND